MRDICVRNCGKALAVALLLALAACGGDVAAPAAHGTAYIPPATPGGRMCVDQCAKSRDYCLDACKLDYRACYNEVQIAAQQQFDRYARDRYASSAPIDMMPSNFEHPEHCNAAKAECDADCGPPYDSCYRSCGGAVTTTSSCKFLCFE